MPQSPTSDDQPSPHIPLRMPLHPGIDEDMIERLVRRFYDAVRVDAQLGPVFQRVIPMDWEPHLKTMMAFWSSVTLMSGRYKGQPMPMHKALSDVGPEHFDRWLDLFRHAARDVCPPDIARVFIDRAEQIAVTLSQGMFGRPYNA
ncbi:MAG: group III truncated hemoglobin [Rhodospirillales bacterium]